MKFSVHFLEIFAQISLNKNQRITFNATNLLNKDNTIAERIAIYNRKVISFRFIKIMFFLRYFKRLQMHTLLKFLRGVYVLLICSDAWRLLVQTCLHQLRNRTGNSKEIKMCRDFIARRNLSKEKDAAIPITLIKIRKARFLACSLADAHVGITPSRNFGTNYSFD